MTTDSGVGLGGSGSDGGVTEGLPAGWIRATLGELGVEVQPGFASGKHNRDGEGILHLRPMNITRNGVLDTLDARYVVDNSDRRVELGDVLFNNTNSPALVGKTAWVDSAEPLAYSNHMTRLRGPEGLDGKFLAAQLQHMWATGYFKSILNNHVNQASVSRKALLDTVIAVPPLAEQRRIVAKLDEQLVYVEAGEAAVEAAFVKQQPLMDSMLDRCVLGLACEPSKESLEDIRIKSSKKINYQSLRALPAGWKWRVAQDVCSSIVSGSTPQASLMHGDAGDIPFLKVYNISKRGFVDFTVRPTFIDRETHEQSLKRSKVMPGDVLTNIVGPPLGKTAVVPGGHPEWNINQAIAAFRAGPEISPEWLRFVLQSPYVIGILVRTARATAGQFNIAISTCRELPIPLPPRPVQNALCNELAGFTKQLAVLHEQVRGLNGEALELREALFRAAFTGTLVPQDPDDEPASLLLDRIRAQRAAEVKPARRKRASRTTVPAAPQASGRPVPSGTQEALPL
ncbi:restriction endonuclease subunit S [Streptomyces sp. NPDC023838]|uniref:restriction endonuclease subunit S n=1 Tax=Streptomyces sp. NPDC023838 TaxID=3154325 RepID=UPI00340A2782